MKRKIIRVVFFLAALSGLLQALLISGFIWNIFFPILQVLLLALYFKWYKSDKLLTLFAVIISLSALLSLYYFTRSWASLRSSEVKKELTVMTYNLFFKNNNPSISLKYVKEADPDILVIQELTPQMERAIMSYFGNKYPYKLTRALEGTHGLGVFSKYAMSNEKFLGNTFRRPFGQIVDLSVAGKSVQVINVHLASPAVAVENKERFYTLFSDNYGIRKKQIARINSIAVENDDRYDVQLLAGDLNTMQSEPIFNDLRKEWCNSVPYLLRWSKFNFPHSAEIPPLITLDYVLARGNVSFNETRVVGGGSSDHLAVMATLKI